MARHDSSVQELACIVGNDLSAEMTENTLVNQSEKANEALKAEIEMLEKRVRR